ncbi:Uncharacterised protein [Vibrio cholerae]|nr:Uncharacterised protein [Vibrio cholerae]
MSHSFFSTLSLGTRESRSFCNPSSSCLIFSSRWNNSRERSSMVTCISA